MINQKIIDELLRNQQLAIQSGNPPFAALIECDDEIVASVSNDSRSSGNPLHHAEIQAIRVFLDTLGSKSLANAHLYSTNEPCPMCVGDCIWSGISKITYFLDQEEIYRIRGWGKFMPASDIAKADDSGICVIGPIKNGDMLKFHEAFWNTGDHAKHKHSIHLT